MKMIQKYLHLLPSVINILSESSVICVRFEFGVLEILNTVNNMNETAIFSQNKMGGVWSIGNSGAFSSI